MPNKLGSFFQGLKRDASRPIDPWATRSRSIVRAERLGYPVNPNLPLIDRPLLDRSLDEVFHRALCLFATSACAYGLDREKAEAWLKQERAYDALSPAEREFMRTGEGDMAGFTGGVEALFVVMWALGFYRRFSFADNSDDDLVSLFPNPTTGESAENLRKRARLRPASQIFPSLDLAYCLHWAVADAKLKGHHIPGDVHPSVIFHRRKALEWLIGDKEWDSVKMDI